MNSMNIHHSAVPKSSSNDYASGRKTASSSSNITRSSCTTTKERHCTSTIHKKRDRCTFGTDHPTEQRTTKLLGRLETIVRITTGRTIKTSETINGIDEMMHHVVKKVEFLQEKSHKTTFTIVNINEIDQLSSMMEEDVGQDCLYHHKDSDEDMEDMSSLVDSIELTMRRQTVASREKTMARRQRRTSCEPTIVSTDETVYLWNH